MRAILAAVATLLVIVGVTTNAEATHRRRDPAADARLVVSWYQRYLGRAPDACGLDNWVRDLARGGNAEAGILGSDEYYIRHGSSPEGFVVGLYVEVLGRDPGVNEVQSWLCRFPAVRGNRTALAADFLRAATTELAQRGAPPVIIIPAYPPPGDTLPPPRAYPPFTPGS